MSTADIPKIINLKKKLIYYCYITKFNDVETFKFGTQISRRYTLLKAHWNAIEMGRHLKFKDLFNKFWMFIRINSLCQIQIIHHRYGILLLLLSCVLVMNTWNIKRTKACQRFYTLSKYYSLLWLISSNISKIARFFGCPVWCNFIWILYT